MKRDLPMVLLKWYTSHARTLPWRDDPTPYRVWISEIMLQQTRVEAVKPYFERFVAEVPSIRALAEIPEERLLKLWEGLGYYSRALNLKKAAQMIVREFGGEMPSAPEDLRKLPGIGPYSAGAIASIAFGIRVPCVDGNVLRVAARITADRGDIADPAVKRRLAELVEGWLPEERIGDFNQALMELGATVCLPNGAPNCAECPMRGKCAAERQGLTAEIPLKAKQKARRVEQRTVFVIERGGRIAIRQRPAGGLLPNLWEFPHAEGHFSVVESGEKLREWGLQVERMEPLEASRHIFSHLEWDMTAFRVQAKGDGDFTWASNDELLTKYSIPAAFQAYKNFD